MSLSACHSEKAEAVFMLLFTLLISRRPLTVSDILPCLVSMLNLTFLTLFITGLSLSFLAAHIACKLVISYQTYFQLLQALYKVLFLVRLHTWSPLLIFKPLALPMLFLSMLTIPTSLFRLLISLPVSLKYRILKVGPTEIT